MIDVPLPDGRTITIDTDDPQKAAAAGRAFLEKAAAPAQAATAPAGVGAGTARSFAQGLTFNFGDEAEAAVKSLFGDETYQQELDQIRAEIEQFREENPGIAIASELGGAVISGLIPGGAVVRGATAANRIGRGVLAGAGFGAATGAGAGEDLEGRLVGAGVGAGAGAALGGVVPAAGAVVGKVVSRLRGQARGVAPSTEDIRIAKKAAYKTFDDTEVRIRPEEFRKIAAETLQEVRDSGFRPALQKKAVVPLAELGTLAKKTEPVSLQEVELLRRVFGAARKEIGTDDARIANMAVDKLDDFVDALKPNQLIRGQGAKRTEQAQKALASLKQGRALHRREIKSEILDGITERAEISAQSQGSRQGIDLNLRREFATLAKQMTRTSPAAKRTRNLFNDQERILIKRAATGSTAENVFTRIGRVLAPKGPLALLAGPGLAGAAGAALGGPIVGGLAATGTAAVGGVSRGIGNALTRANANAAENFIRSAGKLGPQPAFAPRTESLGQALLLGGGSRSIPQF